MWLTLILVTVAVYTLRYFYDTIHAFWIARNIDGPPGLPIIGNALIFVNKTPAGIWRTLEELMQKYGPISRIWIGFELSVVLQDPNDVEIVLSNTRYIAKSSHYTLLRSWLSDGLIFSTGKKWHDRRKLITPAFHFKILDRFVNTFDRLGNKFIDKINDLSSADKGDGIEFFNAIGLYTLDVISETAMGVSVDALSKPDSDYVNSVKAITQVILYRVFNIIYRHPLVFKLSKLYPIEVNAIKVMREFTDDVIQKRRAELITDGSDGNNETDDAIAGDDVGTRKKRALLDILLHSTIDDKPLNDFDIREETDGFMFAGHDTTTTASTFCLYNLAKYPEWQQKCFNEICNVFGVDQKDQQPTTLSMLNQLPYLEATIKESLRLFPPVPLISRLAPEDVKLTKNRIVPKNSIIMIPINRICRNPEVFKDPDSFKPERFLADQQSTEKVNPFAYIPFSAGPRNCIGQKYAMYEVKCILAKLLHNFEVSLAKESRDCDLILCNEIILRTENPIKFHFKKRN